VDEKGPIHARFHNGKRWQSHHHRLEVPLNLNRSAGKTVLFAGYDVHTKELWGTFAPQRNTEGFLDFLYTLAMHLESDHSPTIYLLLDNLKVHHSQAVKEWFREHPQYKPVFLPTYSPQLQPIEGVFRQLHREVIENTWWQSVEDLERAIHDWIAYFITVRPSIHLPSPVINPTIRPRRTLLLPQWLPTEQTA